MLQGRVALVTGAGRGIGRATALALARQGARVMAVARTRAELESLAAEAPVAWLATSLENEDGCDEVIRETRGRLGPIEILVNNASIGSVYDETIFELSTETWRRFLAINLEASFFLTRAASHDMRERGWGRIVMVSSTSGLIGSPRDIGYTTAKHAVIGLMRAVAQDVGPFGITCNAVCPGWVHTEMADRSAAREAADRGVEPAEIWRERDALQPRGVALAPDEVAETIAFLCGEAATGISGQAISVNGGSVV
jgi:NAD(P)-dependent dehydrogenase (short-subunit alcohol dehydrogenase family)